MATPIYALAEMRDQVLVRAKKGGDTVFQGYVDSWFNEFLQEITNEFDFPELMTDWQATLPVVAPIVETWGPSILTRIPSDMVKLNSAYLLEKDDSELDSSDFTNGWTLGSMTAALTSTGPDGTANAASRLTATGANASATRAVTSALAARMVTFRIRRITGTGAVQVTADGGTTWHTISLTSQWDQIGVNFGRAVNPTVGIRLVTSGDAVDVHEFEQSVIDEQQRYRIDVKPSREFARMLGQVNPPVNTRPSRCALYRVEGAKNHLFNQTTGATGIRAVSTATETASTEVGVEYYTTQDRERRAKATVTSLTTSAQSLATGTHFGIKRVGKSAATTGIITIDNTAGDQVYATIMPWERAPFYHVLAFSNLADKPYPFYVNYKRSPEYMSNPSDNCLPLPGEVQNYILARTKARALTDQQDYTGARGEEQEAARAKAALIHGYRFRQLEESRVELW